MIELIPFAPSGKALKYTITNNSGRGLKNYPCLFDLAHVTTPDVVVLTDSGDGQNYEIEETVNNHGYCWVQVDCPPGGQVNLVLIPCENELI